MITVSDYMYRYFLYYFWDYYPKGGMNDCVLKTNDLEELTQFVKDKCCKEPELCSDEIHFYDAYTDKKYIAEFEMVCEYEGQDFKRYFVKWLEETEYEE